MKKLLLIFIALFSITSYAQTWNTQLVSPGKLSSDKHIIYDDQNNPIVISLDGSRYLIYSRWKGTYWDNKIVVTATGNITYTRIARTDTIIHILYKILISGPLKHRRINLEGENLGEINLGGFDITDVSTIDDQYLLYVRSGQSLILRYYDVSTNLWNPEEHVDGSTGFSDASVAANNINNIWISYFENSGANLKIATKINGEWKKWFVDISGDVGRFNKIYVDGNNTPHIIYYDATNQKLKYATFSP